jgi:hypothetical protein
VSVSGQSSGCQFERIIIENEFDHSQTTSWTKSPGSIARFTPEWFSG